MTEIGNRAAEGIVKGCVIGTLCWVALASLIWGIVFVIGALT